MSDPRRLTPAEFEIMEVLWQSSNPRSVAEVLDVILHTREVAYTTVMTLLDKMARKGSVARSKRGKAYLYAPRVRRPEVLQFLVQEFAGLYFEEGETGLRRFLAGESEPPPRAPSEDIDVSLL